MIKLKLKYYPYLKIKLTENTKKVCSFPLIVVDMPFYDRGGKNEIVLFGAHQENQFHCIKKDTFFNWWKTILGVLVENFGSKKKFNLILIHLLYLNFEFFEFILNFFRWWKVQLLGKSTVIETCSTFSCWVAAIDRRWVWGTAW